MRVAVDARLKTRRSTPMSKDGGRVLLTGKSGIDAEKGFLFDVGAKWQGPSPYSEGDYLLPAEPLRASFVSDPLFMYEVAERIKVQKSGASLGDSLRPLFRPRRRRQFSGHVNTPSQPDPSGYDAGSEKGGFTLSWPTRSSPPTSGSAPSPCWRSRRRLDRARPRHGDRLIETSLPRAGRATLRRQAGEKRDVSAPPPRHAGAPRQHPRRQRPADPGPGDAQRHRRLGRRREQGAHGEAGARRASRWRSPRRRDGSRSRCRS